MTRVKSTTDYLTLGLDGVKVGDNLLISHAGSSRAFTVRVIAIENDVAFTAYGGFFLADGTAVSLLMVGDGGSPLQAHKIVARR
jgi:hypothetical protein